eukprot:Phypoly_transcript_08441.p1 GENE.Phypoly_transcript_08441~~Phypoly_transcript_08441.p1  ORF type:complete len:441 (+),score=97.10 Phypoly_transcript_08441:124-1446(+)
MSVNGRPFRPDPTSYQMTGIPCGNPKRYKSRAVIRMTRDDKVPYEDQQIGIPGTGTETEAEKEFKKLLDQQMNISNTAGEKKVNFITSTREIMGTASGFMTLGEFQKVAETDKKTNEFRRLGFTDVQIGVILQQEGIQDLPIRKRKQPEPPSGPLIGPVPASSAPEDGEDDGASLPNCFMPHPDYVSQSLSELRELQGKRDAELSAAATAGPQMSRHMLQLEAALLQGKTHLPLAHIYVNGVKKFSQQLAAINASGASVNDILLPGSVSDALSDDSASSYDSSPIQAVPKSPPSSPEQKVAQKTEQKPATPPAKNGNANDDKVVISGKVESIPDSEFEKGRLPAEEIAKQFPNYNVGTPSKILYVKNLDHNITAQDLVSIFIRFQEEGKDKINFKIMDGKMKGQAFITFHDEQTATKALQLAHGFVFKNKPIIIQYGKQK